MRLNTFKMATEESEPIEEEVEDYFSDGMPDFVGYNFATPKDSFWQMEIEYNGKNPKY